MIIFLHKDIQHNTYYVSNIKHEMEVKTNMVSEKECLKRSKYESPQVVLIGLNQEDVISMSNPDENQGEWDPQY